MTITETVKSQITEAMKAHDALRLSTLKMLSAELHNEWISRQHELSEEEEMAVVRKEVKKRRDAIEAYKSGGREDRAQAEEAELKILQEFLPAELTDTDIEAIVVDSINQTGAKSMSEMGKVMSLVMQKTAGRADGGKVSALVRQKLS